MELLRPGSTVPESAGSAARVVEQLCEQTANLHIDIPPVRRSERLIHENVDPTTPGSAVPLQTGFSPAAAEVEPARTQASESKKPKSCRQLCDVWFIRLAPILFVLIWSTGFIAARFGRPYTPPASFLLARFGFSIPLYLIWGGIGRAKWPVGWKQYFHLSVMGILINFCFLGGVWTAVRLGMGAGLSALITGMQPVLTALWVAFRGGRITWLQWVGLAMGAGGLVLVVWQKLGAGEVTAANALLCCGSLVCITVGTLYQKAFVTPCDVRTANCVQMLAAFAVCLPVAIGVDFVPGLHMVWVLPDGDTNWVLIGVVAWSVLGLSLGGGSLLFVMLQRGAATRVAVSDCCCSRSCSSMLLASHPATLYCLYCFTGAFTSLPLPLLCRRSCSWPQPSPPSSPGPSSARSSPGWWRAASSSPLRASGSWCAAPALVLPVLLAKLYLLLRLMELGQAQAVLQVGSRRPTVQRMTLLLMAMALPVM